MRRIVAILFCIIYFTADGRVMAADYDAIFRDEIFEINDDIRISDNSIIWADEIYVDGGYRIENHGQINGDMFLCDGCDVEFKNYGQYSGEINIGNNGTFTRVISGASDLTRLSVSEGQYVVRVGGDDVLGLSDIMYASTGADKIILEDVSVRFETMRLMRGIQPSIELDGLVTIIINNLSDISDKAILSNIVGGAYNLQVIVKDIDVLQRADLRYDNGNIYLKIMRELDYQKILQDGRSEFLNNIRKSNPDNKTLAAMDTAKTMGELESVMNSSVMFNPLNLLRPIRGLVNFENSAFEDMESGGDASVISSDEYDVYASDVTGTFDVNKTSFSISAIYGELKSSNRLEEFTGQFYGVKIRARHEIESLWIHSTAGLIRSLFDDAIVFNVKNPNGVSVFGALDFGYDFDIDNGFYLAPFIGAASDFGNIGGQTEFNYAARVGAYLGFKDSVNGIENHYRVFAITQTDSVNIIGANIEWWSVVDGIGGGLSYALMRDEFLESRQISAELKFRF